MIQIIEESFDTIENAREYVNNISLKYEYIYVLINKFH